MNFVDHLLFYMKLLNYLFCDMFGSVLECYELTHISWLSTPGNHASVNKHCYPIGCVIKSTHQGICSCSPIVNFFKFTFHHGMATSVIFLIKNNLNSMLCTAQLHGPVLKAFGWVQISPFQMADKSPMITDQLTAGGSVSQLAKLSP